MLDLRGVCDSIKIRADGECRQVVKTSDCGSDMRGFESHHSPHKKANDFCHWLFYLVIGEGENPPFLWVRRISVRNE